MVPLNFLQDKLMMNIVLSLHIIPVVWFFAFFFFLADIYGVEQKENNLPLQRQTCLVHFGAFQFNQKFGH